MGETPPTVPRGYTKHTTLPLKGTKQITQLGGYRFLPWPKHPCQRKNTKSSTDLATDIHQNSRYFKRRKKSPKNEKNVIKIEKNRKIEKNVIKIEKSRKNRKNVIKIEKSPKNEKILNFFKNLCTVSIFLYSFKKNLKSS